MIVRTFTDPTGDTRELHIGTEHAGVAHDTCAELAEVTPEADVAYCTECGWQCRISGAWYIELLEDVRNATSAAITDADLESQWKAERDGAAAVMAEDAPPGDQADPGVAAGLAAAQRIGGNITNEAEVAYILGSVDAARAQAKWVPWWLNDLSIGDTCPCCGEEWTGA